MKTRLIFSLAVLVMFNIIATAQQYVIDKGHSSVQIRIQHFGVVDVVGRFKDVTGSVIYDANDLAKTTAEATINVNSYDANNAGGEEAVKSPAFLDDAAYPEITFKSKSTSIESGQNVLLGDLTIHGITREVELPFTIDVAGLANAKTSHCRGSNPYYQSSRFWCELRPETPQWHQPHRK